MGTVLWILLIVSDQGPVPAGVIYDRGLCLALAVAITEASGRHAGCVEHRQGAPA